MAVDAHESSGAERRQKKNRWSHGPHCRAGGEGASARGRAGVARTGARRPGGSAPGRASQSREREDRAARDRSVRSESRVGASSVSQRAHENPTRRLRAAAGVGAQRTGCAPSRSSRASERHPAGSKRSCNGSTAFTMRSCFGCGAGARPCRPAEVRFAATSGSAGKHPSFRRFSLFVDSVSGAEAMLRSASVLLVVDGYNVSKTGWPNTSLEVERRVAPEALHGLHLTSHVPTWSSRSTATAPGASPTITRGGGAYVVFSEPGEEADSRRGRDRLKDAVAGPLIVVSRRRTAGCEHSRPSAQP